MSKLSDNAKRALDLTALALKIQTKVVSKAGGDTFTQEKVMGEYASCDIAFVTRTFELVSTLQKLAKNPFGIFAFLGSNFKDPYADERVVVQTFCRKWLPYSGVTLSTYEIDLVN